MADVLDRLMRDGIAAVQALPIRSPPGSVEFAASAQDCPVLSELEARGIAYLERVGNEDA